MLSSFILFQLASAIFLRFFTPAGPVYYFIILLHITSGVGIIFILLVYGGSKSTQLNGLNHTVRRMLVATLSFGLLIAINGRSGTLGELIFTAHVLSAIGFLISFFILEKIKTIILLKYGAGVIGIFFLLVSANALAGYIEKNNVASEKTDFFPSPAQTVSQTYLDHAAINQSFRCGTSGCHPDIYSQWQQSAHRFSSFNNPFYTGSVDYLLASSDSTAVRWCAGCHDPVMLHTGLLKGKPDKNSPEAHAGITCEVCHNIVVKPDITGNGKYIIGEPDDYPFSRSTGLLSKVNKMLIRVEPRAHKKNMLKPFHSKSEYCLTCHKVSLDTPINHYRWLRGQDEYDAWQHSGVSGNAVASFYAPPAPLNCQDCHMAYEKSRDKGHDGGQVRGHFFNAANTALPALPKSRNQNWLERTTAFMQDDKISVDLFGIVDNNGLNAPLGDCYTYVPGQELQFEVVVRTRNIGHEFPGGTIDSNEPWLQVEGRDQSGHLVFSSGYLEPDQSVDARAHFFRGLLLDKNGEFILKRNPHEWVTTLYKNSIPPGSAEVIHYRWAIPQDFDQSVKIVVHLYYRKFNRSITETFLENPIDLPIITMATDTLRLLPGTPDCDQDTKAFLRINDYGIGMLRQNNLEAARRAFERVVDINPEYADGFVNLARILIKEGKFSAAEGALDKAIQIKNGLPKAYYFRSLIRKKQGNYKEAVKLFETVRLKFPNDRILLKELGQTYYFLEQFDLALTMFHNALLIDPEDTQAHYNLMLIHKKIGNQDKARDHQNYYLKYKPDEAARAVSQSVRLRFPNANNEAQLVHHHEL